MATVLGPATIELKINTAKARRELDTIKQSLSTIKREETDKAQRKQEEVKQSEKINKNVQASSKIIQTAAISRMGRLSKAIITGAALTGTFMLAEYATSIAGAVVKEKTEGIPLGQELGEAINDALQKFSNKLSDFRSEMLSLIPAAMKTGEITRAQYMLGERPSVEHMTFLGGILWDVEATMKRSEVQKDKIFKQQLGVWLDRTITKGLMR